MSRLILIAPYADGAALRATSPFTEALSAVRASGDMFAYAAFVASLHGMQVSHVLESTTPEMIAAYEDAREHADVTDLLPRIEAPTLIIHPVAYPRSLSQKVAAAMRDARVVATPGTHFVLEQTRAITDFLRAGRPEPAPAAMATAGESPRSAGQLRTVLFTDIVGHTEMMRRLGDAKGRDVLREHERITRDLLRQHGGAEVKSMGDGFMASFSSVTASMECAIALQRAFDVQNLEPGTENLNVRVGLNAGEPIEEDGDLFGATVILASRIAAKAEAGEILVPETVRGLLSGKGFLFGDRGEFVPKGFDDAVRLYEVRWRE